MDPDAARQALIDALTARLPVGSWTVDTLPGSITTLWLLPEATEKLAAILAGAK
jgi:hypothetical protein